MAESIRVCLRFRPMNKVESQEDGNQICIKLSGCRRAVQIQNPEHPNRPHMFNFDQIYPPGVTQEAVYQYTGRPLVENTMKGFNSTLFAYGQTGSGKTFSMMGVLGNETLEGIVPKVIGDIFKEIMALETEDEYSVSMSMCEIYLEKVKDLIAGDGKSLRIRLDEDNMVYVEGITEVFCHTADECLQQIENGNMNRATSATRMNAESSRSHCVIIMNVICKKPNGSIRTSKVKMIDLAGSETVKKTEATGARLEEAKAINRSLSELNGVLTALGTPGKHVTFRNSALTKLLQDSLGGNAKTSLLLAASPCSYNREETISSLRFGERAKKVKSNAVINEELTIDEYKTLVKKLKRENALQKKLLQLKDAQLAAAGEWVSGKGGDWDSLVEESQFNLATEHEGEDDIDLANMDFDSVKISSAVSVLDKKTGKMVAGSMFEVNIDETPEDRVKREAASHASAVNNACRALHRQLTVGSPNKYDAYEGRRGGKIEDLLDEIEELNGMLHSEEMAREEVEEMLHTAEQQYHESERELSQQKMELQELAVYKQKCLFLKQQSEIELARLAADLEYFQLMADDCLTDDEREDAVSDLFDGCEGDSAELRQRFTQMAQQLRKQERVIAALRTDANKGNALSDALIQNIVMADTEPSRKEAIKKMIVRFTELKSDVKRLEKQRQSHEQRIANLTRKDKCTDTIKANWGKRLATMENALMQTVRIYKKEKHDTARDIEQKDYEIGRLKEHVKRLNLARSHLKSTNFRPIRKRSPSGEGKKRRRSAKHRPGSPKATEAQAVQQN